jgi:hypothetical protein
MASDRLATPRPVAGQGMAPPPAPANLADVLERILDKGLVVAGDIRIDLMGIELLTIKIRLLLSSADKAEELGMAWWRNDPYFTGQEELEKENRQLRARLERLEELTGAGQPDEAEAGRLSSRSAEFGGLHVGIGSRGQASSRTEESARGGSSEAAEQSQLTEVGGGWYELPSGRRVQGRDAAQRALQEDQ